MSERSLGAGEGWEYAVPSLQDLRSKRVSTIEVGSGSRIISRSLPLGWTAENYGDQQIGPEQFIWKGTDSIIFSKNIVDGYYFTYSKGTFFSYLPLRANHYVTQMFIKEYTLSSNVT